MKAFSRSLGTALWDKKDAELSRRWRTVLGVGHTGERGNQDPIWRSTGGALEEHWVPMSTGDAHSHVLTSLQVAGATRATVGRLALCGWSVLSLPLDLFVLTSFSKLHTKTSPLSKSTAEFRPTDGQPLPQGHYALHCVCVLHQDEMRCRQAPLVRPAANHAPLGHSLLLLKKNGDIINSIHCHQCL